MISDFGLLWANETDITEANVKIFGWDQVKNLFQTSMVHFPKKIMGQFFFSEKRANRGGGSEGGLSKGHNFSVFFLGTLPLFSEHFIAFSISSNHCNFFVPFPSIPGNNSL